MAHAQHHDPARRPCQVLDFDEALLDACPPQVRAEVMMEAQLLAAACSPGIEARELQLMADQLSAGARDYEMARAKARRLAAALKRVARAA